MATTEPLHEPDEEVTGELEPGGRRTWALGSQRMGPVRPTAPAAPPVPPVPPVAGEIVLGEDADIEEAVRRCAFREALTMLMNRYGDRVFALAYAMLRDASLADDVRQQVFVEAFRDLPRFELRAPIRVWLFRIARNRALDAARRRWRTNRLTEWLARQPPEEVPPDDRSDHVAVRVAIEQCLERLAPAARLAVIQRYFEELSYEDAERQTGTRAGTLQRRVARALPVLRTCLDIKLRRGAR